ncbi:MAG: FecR family protein, partial [Planctomycetales bacterium]|nr:FecR family protein [Planctomycetales bacterium]
TARVGAVEGKGSRSKVQGSRSTSLTTSHQPLATNSNPQSLIPNPLFAVRTPTAIVTDLGTEFGVEVDERGRTESYVFAGKVRLAMVGRQAGNAADRVLLAGQAGRVDGESVVVAAADGDGTQFVRKLPVREPPPEPPPEVELIGRVDYSDTWTAHSPTRSGGYVPLESPEALQVEQFHGNPPRSWVFSAPTAVATWPSGALSGSWPGFPARGAKSGFTERSGLDGVCYLGLEYGLRDDFTVQFDAVQTDDRINITIGDEPATIYGARSLSVFFRAPGGPHPEIGLFTPSKGEVDTKLRSGIPAPFQWHNYAVRFNLREKRLTVWVDGECRGTIGEKKGTGPICRDGPEGAAHKLDLSPFSPWTGLSWTNQYVTVGGYSENADCRVWTDNFRLGAPAAEKKGTGPICRDGPEGASHKLDLSPFSPTKQEKPVTKGEQNHDVDVTK